MPRVVKCGLIQTHCETDATIDVLKIKDQAHNKTMPLVEEAGKQGVQMLCLQELYAGPYFCAEQDTRWYETVEKIPDGPTTKLFQEIKSMK